MPASVMIVDDHAVIRRLVRQLLEAESLVVSDAEDGAEGIRKAEAEQPDLIILDLSMPVMNGLEAARKLKLLLPNVPLLMFTNNVGGIVENEARSAGISAVISKSESGGPKQLLASVKQLLKVGEGGVPKAS
jgi:two-component system chemotaxis response regulator CheY